MSTQPKTFQELIDGETPVLVDFTAVWCGPCKMMHPILEDTAKQMGDKVKIVKVPFVEIEKLRKLEIGYFEKHITLKVRVDKMKFITRQLKPGECPFIGS